MPYVVMSGTRSLWADLQKVTPAPTTYELLREFRGLCGACANLNAQSVSNTSYGLYRGDDNEAPEVTSHPFLEVLKRPNPYMDSKLLWRHTQLSLELCGRAYWKLVPGVLTPVVEVYPLQAQLVSQRVGAGNQIVGWQYDKETLALDQVVQFFNPDPLNPYGSGRGPAEIAWSEIALMNSDTAMMTALMQNGGVPGYVGSIKDAKGIAPPGLIDRIYDAWNSFKGRKAGGLYLPELPMDFTPLAQTSKDFEGSARFNDLKSVILACFNIPSALFSSAGTRAELDAAMVQHARLAVDPRTTLLESVINRRILPLSDDGVNLFFTENLYEDQTAAASPSEIPTPPNPSSGTAMNTQGGAA